MIAKVRDNKVNAIKGFAILCVVIGHAIQGVLGERMDNSVVFRIIYSFHMPLFIFVSGYIYGKYAVNYDLKWLKNRFMGLDIPFYVWAVLLYIIRDSAGAVISLYERMENVIRNPSDNGLWFLITLFWCCLMLSIFFYSSKMTWGGRKIFQDEIQSKQYWFIAVIFLGVVGVSFLIKALKISMPYRFDLWYINFFLQE